MRFTAAVLLALMMAGCTGVSTGVRSECFGNDRVDGTFGAQGATLSFRAVAIVDDSDRHNCRFEDQ